MTEIQVIQRLKSRSTRFLRLIELKAPQTIVDKERELIQKAVDMWNELPLAGEDFDA